MKKEIRIIAWDDCGFEYDSEKVRLIGVIYRGGDYLDGMLSTIIIKDGLDATDKIGDSINKSRHKDQLQYVMLDGISYGGFNLVDIKDLNNMTGLPIIVVQRKMVDIKKFKQALKNVHSYELRKQIVKNAGQFYRWSNMFYQKYGVDNEEVEKVLEIATLRSNVPEPLRVAHIIASGISGESRGGA